MRRIFYSLLLCVALLVSPSITPAQQSLLVGKGNLTPASFQEKMDLKGGTWNLQQNGVLNRPRTGQGMIGNGLMLFINNQQFQNYQPQTTPDGEFILPGQSPVAGITVTRRMKLLEKEGVLRVVELLHNPSSSEAAVTLEIRNNFNGRFSGYYTDSARAAAPSLQQGETGLLVIPQTSNQRAYLFSLCSSKGKLRPTISQQNQYQLNISFALKIPAGRTVAVAYTVSQALAPARPDARWVGKHLREISLSRHLKGLHRDITSRILNQDKGGGDDAKLLASNPLEEIGITRGKRDILAMGETSRLLGSASCSDVQITSHLGTATIPFEDVAALVGSQGGKTTSSRLFLRDGQIFRGNIETENFRFVLTAGANLEIDPSRLDRLVRAPSPGEGEWADGVVAMLLTARGDRLAAMGPAAAPLSCATPWGSLDFTLDDILWISSLDSDSVGHRIRFKDGNLLTGYLSGADLHFDNDTFGDISMPPNQLRALLTQTAASDPDEENTPAPDSQGGLSGLKLTGGQKLSGRILAPEIVLLGDTENIPLNPSAIRRMEIGDTIDPLTGTAPFTIELWGGGVLHAPFRDSTIPVEVRGQRWQVPVSAILEYSNPTPTINEDARKKITALIRKLGSEDWTTREEASESLSEFGHLARGLLSEALGVSPDPEVRHRLEQLLSKLP